MNREELEAVIWQAMRKHTVTTRKPVVFIEDILRAADAYAAEDSEDVTRNRRKVLHDASRRMGRPA